MALDRTRDFFGITPFRPEDLAATTPAWFWTRWITHLCAPYRATWPAAPAPPGFSTDIQTRPQPLGSLYWPPTKRNSGTSPPCIRERTAEHVSGCRHPMPCIVQFRRLIVRSRLEIVENRTRIVHFRRPIARSRARSYGIVACAQNRSSCPSTRGTAFTTLDFRSFGPKGPDWVLCRGRNAVRVLRQ